MLTKAILLALMSAGVAAFGAVGWLWWSSSHASAERSHFTHAASLETIELQALDCQRRGDLAGLVRVWDGVPDDSAEKPRALLEQALAYRQMADGVQFERTIAECLAREVEPRAPSRATLGAWGILIDHYLLQERWEEAEKIRWKIFHATSELKHKKYILLRLLAPDDDRYDPSEAIAWHERFVSRNPEDFDSQRALGLNLARGGRSDEARRHLEACATKNPHTPRFVDSWLWFLFRAEDIQAAERVLEALPPEFEMRDDFWVHRGKLLQLRGEWDQAVGCFRRALALAPHRVDANERLLQALRAGGIREELAQQTRVSKQIAEAKGTLLDMRQSLLREGTTPDSQTCATLSNLCRTLGWDKEADAWRTLE